MERRKKEVKRGIGEGDREKMREREDREGRNERVKEEGRNEIE